MSVYEAWAAVMAEVQGLGKHERNTAPNGNFNFRGIDAVLNAVGPALRSQQVMVVPNVRRITKGTTTTSKGNVMTTADVEVEYTIWGPDGDSITTSAPGEAFDSGDKATSKAMSVAFRTMLLQTLCLPTNEPDPDTQSYEQGPTLAQAKRRAWQLTAGKAETDEGRTKYIDAALSARGLSRATATVAEWMQFANELEGK